MDTPLGMPHGVVMESSKDWSEGKSSLLSVVVDDDDSMRESLPDLLREFGFAARAFSSADAFLSSDCIDQTSILILDVAMPDMSGPELYDELRHRGKKMPVIFITGQRDESVRARLLKQGAAGFLLKPFNDAALLEAINIALQPT